MSKSLGYISLNTPHEFKQPIKRILEGQDVNHFMTTYAYRDICIFITQLNHAICPRKLIGSSEVRRYLLSSPPSPSEAIGSVRELLRKVEAIILEAPPDTGPRRFGNVSFRRWHEMMESRAPALLQAHLSSSVLEFTKAGEVSALDELLAYFLGAFGSAQRLDYGTGHELSFLAFLGGIWKLGGFNTENSIGGAIERDIIFNIIEPYVSGTKPNSTNLTKVFESDTPFGSHLYT